MWGLASIVFTEPVSNANSRCTPCSEGVQNVVGTAQNQGSETMYYRTVMKGPADDDDVGGEVGRWGDGLGL